MNIFGHRTIRERLLQQYIDGKVAPFLLCIGPDHVGKSTVMRRYAQVLLHRSHDMEECGTLPSAHPDLVHHTPQIVRRSSGARTVASLGIDDIRALSVPYRPHCAPYRVILVEAADTLTPAAQNALLKVLEEPPPSTVFLFTTAHPSRILPTVRSRARVILFHRSAPETVRAAVAADGVSGARCKEISALADGCIGRALRMARDEELYRWYRDMTETGNAIVTMTTAQRCAVAAELSRDIPRAREALEVWMSLYRHRLRRHPRFATRLAVLLRTYTVLRDSTAHPRLILEAGLTAL